MRPKYYDNYSNYLIIKIINNRKYLRMLDIVHADAHAELVQRQ